MVSTQMAAKLYSIKCFKKVSKEVVQVYDQGNRHKDTAEEIALNFTEQIGTQVQE